MMKKQNICGIYVNGNSMEPLLKSGDWVIIERNNFYHPGDILVFKDLQNSINIIHRLLTINQDGCLICKGDNSFDLDIVDGKLVVGKAVAFERYGICQMIKRPTKKFLDLGIRVNKLYLAHNKNIHRTIIDPLYRDYIIERSAMITK